jgi:hypothetical protein
LPPRGNRAGERRKERVEPKRTRSAFLHSPAVTVAGDGPISVLTLGANPEILAVNDMQEGVSATPALVGSAIYVRKHSTLFAFGTK